MPAAINRPIRNAVNDGNSWPASEIVNPVKTAPITALEIDVPSDRARALMPLAAAVSDTGTAALISAGIEAYAKPTPTLATTLNTITFGALPSNHGPAR